jgi:AraC-like DNA-binding protein
MKFLNKTLYYIHSKKIDCIPLLIIALLLLFSFHKSRLTIYPNISKDKIEVFDDQNTGGNSSIDQINIADSILMIDYTLKNKIPYPFAGIKLVIKDTSHYKDLSSYDHLSIDLETGSKQDLNIFLHSFVPGFTRESNGLSYRYLAKTVKFQQLREHFTIPVKSFTVPTWWYVANNIPEDSLPDETYEEVAEIIIESGYTYDLNTPYSFTLHKISFRKDMVKRALWALGAGVVWFLLYSLLNLLLKKQKSNDKKTVIISYEPLLMNNDSDECLHRIVSYISKEYKNPLLTVNQVATEVGIVPAKITQILREKKNCSYKQYLNTIRLAEAKRLLLETDRNIVYIALKVGYNNVTHFNRIFKETEGISPRQYRSSVADSSKS